MALIRSLIGAHVALDAKEGATPPPSASAPASVQRKKPSPHDHARDALVEAIDHGALSPKTAYGDVFPFPYSAMSGRGYHGQNILTLAMKAHAAGYETGAWMTHSAAAKNGWRVRKGERHAKVFMHRPIEVRTDDIDEDTGEPVTKTVPVMKQHQVFNIAQLVKEDGSPVTAADVARRQDAVPAGRKPSAEAAGLLNRIAEGMGIEVQHDPTAQKATVDDATLTVPAAADDRSPDALSELARGLIRISVSESLRSMSVPDPEKPDPQRDAAFNLRVAMAEAMASMHLGFPIEGGRTFDPADLDRLLSKDKRAGRQAAGDAENAVRYMLSFDPNLRYPLRSEEEQVRDEVFDAFGEDAVFDAGEIDFDYVEARSGVRVKP